MDSRLRGNDEAEMLARPRPSDLNFLRINKLERGCRGEISFALPAAKERGALNVALPGEKFFAPTRQRLPPIEVSAFEPKPL
jgi:hypothetical protein